MQETQGIKNVPGTAGLSSESYGALISHQEHAQVDDLRQRIAQLGMFDVANLLGDALNMVADQLEAGDLENAERQVEWWERALGVDLNSVVDSVRVLRRYPFYRQAATRFMQQQEFRTTAMQHLLFAIVERSQQRYDRWRWIARAYAQHVQVFVSEHDAVLKIQEKVDPVDAVRTSQAVRHHKVLQAGLEVHRRAMRSGPHTNGTRRLHNATRALQIANEVLEHEERRGAAIRQRDELRELAAHRIGPHATEAALLGKSTIREQVQALARAINRAEQTRVEDDASRSAADLVRSLSDGFNHYGRFEDHFRPPSFR
jgi:uncharacterized small protein (DUF1192 family)